MIFSNIKNTRTIILNIKMYKPTEYKQIDKDVSNIISSYVVEKPLKLLDWIPKDKLNWYWICKNNKNMNYILQNYDKIDWKGLSGNTHPTAIKLLENNQDKINWHGISHNENAIHILEKNIDKIKWDVFSYNKNSPILFLKYPDFIHKIYWDTHFIYRNSLYNEIFDKYHEKYFDKINWNKMSMYSNNISLMSKYIDKLNWEYLSCNIHAVELLEKHQNKIYWELLSQNINAIKLLENNIDKLDWLRLSQNKNAIHILEKYPLRINYHHLSINENAIHILEKNVDKISWKMLLYNNKADELIQKNIDKIINEVGITYIVTFNNSNVKYLKNYSHSISRVDWNYIYQSDHIFEVDEEKYKNKIKLFNSFINRLSYK
jgi:hypothetical protein